MELVAGFMVTIPAHVFFQQPADILRRSEGGYPGMVNSDAPVFVIIQQGKGPFQKDVNLPDDKVPRIVSAAGPVAASVFLDTFANDIRTAVQENDACDVDVGGEKPCLSQMPWQAVEQQQNPLSFNMIFNEVIEQFDGYGKIFIFQKCAGFEGMEDDGKFIFVQK